MEPERFSFGESNLLSGLLGGHDPLESPGSILYYHCFAFLMKFEGISMTGQHLASLNLFLRHIAHTFS